MSEVISGPDFSVREPAAPEAVPNGLESTIGYTFRDPELLLVALTHRSYSNEQGEDDNFERLEFLGDAVLGLITAHWLYERFPGRPEGELAKLKGFVVSAPVLSRHARRIGIGQALRLGVGEQRSGGRSKASILADALEAIFGAVYLDGGLPAARKVIVPILEDAAIERSGQAYADPKTVLQELVQGRGWELPVYRLVKETGPDHRKTFTVECRLQGQVAGSATGGSKKQAEQGAAAASLAQMDLGPGEEDCY